MSKDRKGLRGLMGAAATALLGLALVRELRRPRDQRTWHGQVLGVPYDLRRPTWQRFRDSWWAPQDARLVTPRAMGVGWSLNLGRLVAIVRRRHVRG